jgi:hypothetical protein
MAAVSRKDKGADPIQKLFILEDNFSGESTELRGLIQRTQSSALVRRRDSFPPRELKYPMESVNFELYETTSSELRNVGKRWRRKH